MTVDNLELHYLNKKSTYIDYQHYSLSILEHQVYLLEMYSTNDYLKIAFY